MVTRKFEVRFDHARICNPEIELSAKVTTDHASHTVTQRMGRQSPTLWIANCRTYTPAQEAHVRQLFTYQEPLVREVFDRWLLAHNLPTLEEISASGQDISAFQDASGKVTSVHWKAKEED